MKLNWAHIKSFFGTNYIIIKQSLGSAIFICLFKWLLSFTSVCNPPTWSYFGWLLVVIFSALNIIYIYETIRTLIQMKRSIRIFNKVELNKRETLIEAYINECLIAHPEVDDIKEAILLESDETQDDNPFSKPFYMACLSYCYLYLEDDIESAVKCAKECLLLLDCYSKEDIFSPPYTWFVKEDKISKHLFDERGLSNIPYNPYRT